ncbi:MAG: hypothetical protein PHY59_06330 [Methanobacterium sp.]|nr:hypothetical protein [Methanobacterium sp.]
MGPDEVTEKLRGDYIYDSIFNTSTISDSEINSLPDNIDDYGPGYALISSIILNIFKIDSLRNIFLFRHFLSFFIYFIGLIFFYLLSNKFFKNNFLSFLSLIFLILSPRIFGEAFTNTKDTIFMSFFIISAYTLFEFYEKKTLKYLFFHSLSTALLVDTRILGLIMIFLTLLLFIFDFFKFEKNKFKIFFKKNELKLLFIYLILSSILIILFWPKLWSNPLYLFTALKNMANHDMIVNENYFGESILSNNLPWHYTIVWIFISTPLIYSFLFLIGIFILFKSKEIFKNKNLIIFLWFFIPLFMIIVLKSTIYDTWRHLFFIYPAFILITVYGFNWLNNFFKNKKYKKFVSFFYVAILIGLILTLVFIIKNHPYQNVYFNPLIRATFDLKENFELDNMGMSIRQGLEYIVNNDKRDNLNVSFVGISPIPNLYILNEEDSKRINLVHLPDYVGDYSNLNYFLTNFRWWSKNVFDCNKVYSIDVEGTEILMVCKLN